MPLRVLFDKIVDEQRNIPRARSANRGRLIVTTFSRWYKSSWNVPSAIAFAKSRFVADRIRTFTLTGSFEHNTRNFVLSNTRSSLICVGIGMSPTSSKNSVPPSAYSNFPWRSADASVNAPRMCPEQFAFENVLAQCRTI